jgi:uncharacterized membrane protein YfcA
MKMIICLFFLTLAITALSQTNPAPVIPVAPEQIVVSNADQALGAFIHYKAPSINFENAVKLAGSLMAIVLVGARYLRKIIPDSWQVNKAGLALAHVAGEINPSILKLAVDASNQQILKLQSPAQAGTTTTPTK